MYLSKESEKTLIMKLLEIDEEPKGIDIASDMIGKVVMVRTYSAGVHFGELVARDGKEVLLKDSRRIFSWTKACSLSQLAIEGSKDIDNCKIAMAVPQQFLSEMIELIPMSSYSISQLKEAPLWKK